MTPQVSALPPLPERAGVTEIAPGPERPVRELQVALVGEVRGEIEPCGCPTLPYGGFVRRERMLERLEELGPVLHIDAGELLLKGLVTNRSESRQARAELLMQLSRDVGVDVWVPGPTDLLALGEAGLADLVAGRLAAPPAVSATWVDAEGAGILPPALVVQEGELRIGVIGLSAAPGRKVSGVQQRSVEDAVRAGLAALPEGLDLVVAAGNIDDDAAKTALAAAPEVALMLKTKDDVLEDPERIGESLVVETSDRGRYLHVLDLRLASVASQPVELALDEQDWRDLRTLRAQARGGKDVSAALAALDSRFEVAGRGRNLGTLRAVPLAGDLDGEAAVAPDLEAFKAATIERAEEVAKAPPAPMEPGYASSGRCLNCHRDEFTRWTLTDHARAYESLIAREAGRDPECVGCHSTGFGEPGGFGELSRSTLARFKGVQCEACHGPMRGHPESPEVKSRPVDVDTCLRCHDEANSPDFDHGSYLRRATCQDMGAAPATP